MTPTDWTPGLIILGMGLLAGVLYLLLTRSRGKSGLLGDSVLAGLERAAEADLEELKELTQDRHLWTPERFAAEKARLELKAAASRRAVDRHLQDHTSASVPERVAGQPTPAAPPVAAPSFASKRPQLVGALWGGALVVFFGAVLLLLQKEQKPKVEPGGAETQPAPAEASRPPVIDAELARAMERARTNPEDVELAARVVHELILRQAFEPAHRLTERSLGADPFHVENRVHRAALRATRGETQASSEELKHLEETYPDAVEALLFRGLIAMEGGNARLALDCLQRFVAQTPPERQPAQLPAAIAELKRTLGGTP